MWGTESSQAPCDRRSSLPAGSLCHPLFSVQAACLPPPTSSPCFGWWLAAVVTLLLSYLSSSSSFRITVCPHPRAHTLFSHQLFLPQLWLKNTPSLTQIWPYHLSYIPASSCRHPPCPGIHATGVVLRQTALVRIGTSTNIGLV
jgi:hypothetical protein